MITYREVLEMENRLMDGVEEAIYEGREFDEREQLFLMRLKPYRI